MFKALANLSLLLILVLIFLIPVGVIVGLKPEIGPEYQILGLRTKDDQALYKKEIPEDVSKIWVKNISQNVNRETDLITYSIENDKDSRFVLYSLENISLYPVNLTFYPPLEILGPQLSQKINLLSCLDENLCQTFVIYDSQDGEGANRVLNFKLMPGEKRNFELAYELYEGRPTEVLNSSFELSFGVDKE